MLKSGKAIPGYILSNIFMKPIQIIKKLFVLVFFILLSGQHVFGAEDLSVHFFYGIGCPHCATVEPFIEEIKPKYPEVEFKTFEVYQNRDNALKLNTWFDSYNVPPNRRGVPIVFLNGRYLIGDTPILNNLEPEIEKLIAENQKIEPVAVDVVPIEPETKEADLPFDPAPELQEEPIPTEVKEPAEQPAEPTSVAPWQNWHWWIVALIGFVIFYTFYRFWTAERVCICLTERQKDFIIMGVAFVLLIGFFILAKNISTGFLEEIGYTLPLPIFTFFIALIDGFNPCNLFVLTFLLALLTSASHSKGRIYAVGFSFIFVIFVIYFLFMAAWLNIFKYIGFIAPLRVSIAMIALIAGVINCKELLFFRKGVTLMIQDRHKGPLVRRIEHMKDIIEKGTVPVLISSSIALAAFASLVELPCTAGFPIIYTGILSAMLTSTVGYYLYLALYNLIYVLPLAVVITIFGYTFHGKQISKRQMQIIKFIGGLIMIVLGIILLVNPGMIGIAS